MRPVIGLILTAVAASTAAAFAFDSAHLTLTKSRPEKDSTVSTPSEIQLWFNQEIQLSVSRIDVKRGEELLETGSVQKTDDPKSFKADLLEFLDDGVYVVQWRSAGPDGHVIRGKYAFTVGSEVER